MQEFCQSRAYKQRSRVSEQNERREVNKNIRTYSRQTIKQVYRQISPGGSPAPLPLPRASPGRQQRRRVIVCSGSSCENAEDVTVNIEGASECLYWRSLSQMESSREKKKVFLDTRYLVYDLIPKEKLNTDCHRSDSVDG